MTGTKQHQSSPISLCIAGVVATAVLETKPWENKSAYPSLYPAHAHRVTEGYE